MKSHKVGKDLLAIKKNFHAYRPAIAGLSFKMFWISFAITLSFILSQVYLLLH